MNMKKITNSLLTLAILLTASVASVPVASAQLRPPNVYVSSGLIIRYTGGTLYTGTTATTIATGTITITGSKSSCTFPALSSCDIIYWPGSGTALLSTATPATAFTAGNIVLGTATTNTTDVLVLNVFSGTAPGASGPGWNQKNSNYLSDGYFFVSPANCGSKATTTTTTDNGMVPAATGNVVHQFTTNATGGTTQITCVFNLPGRTTAGKGVLVTDVSLLYGVQTTAISSVAAATVKTVTYPAGGTGTAGGTVAQAGGTLTVVPASLDTATTTTGQCYNESLTFATLVGIDNLKSLSVDQVFTNSAAATVYQVCGLIVHYFNAPL